MKMLVRMCQSLFAQLFAEPKPRNYSLAKEFCSNCAETVSMVFPAYLVRKNCHGNVYLKIIDDKTYQKVYQTFKKVGVETIEEKGESAYFQQLITGCIYDKGFYPITELDYHIEFTHAAENSNLMHHANRKKAVQ